MGVQFGYPREKLLQYQQRQSYIWQSCIAYETSCVKKIYAFL